MSAIRRSVVAGVVAGVALSLLPAGPVHADLPALGTPVPIPTRDLFPSDVVAGDFDGDGVTDVVVEGEVDLYRGRGDGTFQAPTSTPEAGSPRIPAAVDMDGDGDLDLPLSSYAGNTQVGVLFNDGTGTFTEGPRRVITEFLSTKQQLLVADLDGDGDSDFAIGGRTGPLSVQNLVQTIAVVLNDGTGGLSPAAYYPAPANFDDFIPLSAGDVTGDGAVDIVIGSAAVYVLPGDGSGGFGPGQTYPIGASVLRTLIGDYDLDGDQDIAAVRSGGISVLLADGAGGFAAPTLYPVSGELANATSADLDGDGALDVIAAPQRTDSNLLTVAAGDGTGGFGPSAAYPAGGPVIDLAVAQVSGDGRLDVVVLSRTANFAVLEQGGSTLRAELRTRGECGSDFLLEGQARACAVTVTNAGPDPARDVVLTIDVGGDLAEIEDLTSSGLACAPTGSSPPDYGCTTALLAAGRTVEVTWTLQIAAALPTFDAEVPLTFAVRSATGDGVFADNVVERSPGLRFCTIDRRTATAGQTITGTTGNDVICGSDFDDKIRGGGGNDRVYARGGTNVVYGEDGEDFLYGEDGSDFLNGGNGNDLLYGGAGRDALAGGAGTDACDAGAPPNAAIRSCP